MNHELMNYTPLDDTLIRIIDDLTCAVNVCYEAEGQDITDTDDYTKTYPYATGWSRSVMSRTIDDLSKIVAQLRADV